MTTHYAAIWDLNGVIIDDMLIHYESYREVLGPLGYDMDMPDFVARCTGSSMKQVFAGVLPLAKNPIDMEEAIERKMESYFRLAKGRMIMLPGADDMIRGLAAKGFAQAIASGATQREIDVILDLFGVDSFFKARVGVEDVCKGKPDPEPFATAAQRLGVDTENCIVFEDGEFGIRGAKACGMKVIGITNTLPAEDLAAADIVVHSLEEITSDDIVRLFKR